MKWLADQGAAQAHIVMRAWSDWVGEEQEAAAAVAQLEEQKRLKQLHDVRVEAHVGAALFHLANRDDLACLYRVWVSWQNEVVEGKKQLEEEKVRMKALMGMVAGSGSAKAHLVLRAWSEWLVEERKEAVAAAHKLDRQMLQAKHDTVL